METPTPEGTPIYFYTKAAPPASPPIPNAATSRLAELDHLLLDDNSLFEPYARRAFFSAIILHFGSTPYPLPTLQIVRAKTVSRELGPKNKEELKDAWYCALVAPDPSLELGFKILVTGPAYVGSERAARKQAFLGLRDRLEEMTHEKFRMAGRKEERVREVAGGESGGSGLVKGSWSGSAGGAVTVARELV
ncbi:hypothetical protein K432DRAFT_444134 [Lepidopterella palustris CBS 459.81]|uniref:Uncharacterized protein n=1 Tax=Lepidopterella palustris CBS 459.81 TaxID=1314670 RepID=A0A8E2JDZ3_9PEZI|nr:hypothetical protein K432DRAFT_444134 [Lepidopterella palustris CBS 459.81]